VTPADEPDLIADVGERAVDRWTRCALPGGDR